MNGKVMLCGAVHEPRPNDKRGSSIAKIWVAKENFFIGITCINNNIVIIF
jgi:hypothetical protein